ncbi:DUF4309 domain-containing protein [Paenibacillus cremeus]|uniref:DUF4309 domain-containing protein n=1 Tax=Paenibacillus cremeus TaxID=2163881 RepID=A0A559K879_9BACL|nr:DUF4309 domain-containing protein [Paenibacillus cremeus]TVY08327.1 DUF4309 domain-containing protein [Paenibacillus cremeus]
MNRRRSFIGFLSVAVVVMIFTAGCQHKQAGPVEPVKTQLPETAVVQPTPQTAVKPVESTVPAPVTPPGPQNDKVALASSDSAVKAPDAPSGSDPKRSTGAKPKLEISAPYTQAKPTLLGLTLKTDLSEIKAKLGEPKDTFVMDDDADPITVYNYSDFQVGFNKQNQLQFVDVRSHDIDPGLNGLKLGDPVADVTKALGKPDGNTSLVLTYKASGALLKLDIDPKTQKVNSIKLFAE